MANKKKYIGQTTTIAERRKVALQLRQAGMTYRDIAIALTNKGFPCKFTTAYKDVVKALDEISKKTHEEAESLRELELTRMDVMLKSIWSRVMKGDVAAIDRALRISERRSKLLGIDAPQHNIEEIVTNETPHIKLEFIKPNDDDD